MAGGYAGHIVANVNPESCPDATSAPVFVRMPAEANVRLIAAAPDLLEALQITRGNIASLGPAGALTPYTSYQEWLAMVDAAIAKALGEQA